MRLYELLESIDKDQESVGQVPGEESARKISPVLGKAPKQHPFKGRLVGEESEQGVAEGDDKIADRYDQDEWDEKVQRLKKLAGMGPLKTVWDPVKRVYKNVPVNTPKETDVDEASLATMRDYFAGNKDAHDEYEITKQRKYYQELKQKEELERRRRQELQKAGTTRIGGSK